MDDVKVALLETFEIEIPGVLKGHAGKAEGMSSNALQKKIPPAKTRPLLRRATGACGKRPELLLKLLGPERSQPCNFTPAAGVSGVVRGPGLEFPSRHEHKIPMK
jgi:hypothetical protein